MKQIDSSIVQTYFEFCCTLAFEDEELWSWFCFGKGALGVETMAEFPTELTLRIFFQHKPLGGAEKLVDDFRNETASEATIKISEEGIRPFENWQANWREHFRPVKVGQSLIILPSWETGFEFDGRHPVWIDPGQGFGTGHHLSTALALEMLEQYLLNIDTLPERMLDIGIGSGILAIAACRLGIQKVEGVDIEAEAVSEVERNSKLNGLSARVKSVVGQPSSLKKSAPLVISNMLLRELLDIRLDLVRLTSPGGTLICSGLLGEQVDELNIAVKQLGFEYCSTLESENWRAVQFKRPVKLS
ncbi:MAG: 50S ribosomal protein L11 methyltransferase [SAR324 cluster bacterium]